LNVLGFAGSVGGAIFNGGMMKLTNTTVSFNSANILGGGIRNEANGDIPVPALP